MLVGISLPAALAVNEEQPGEVTTHFVSLHHAWDTEGRTLLPTETSVGGARPAPAIPDYVFVGYTIETTHVYSRQHLQYIRGYPDGSVRPENELTRAEAAMIFYRLFNFRERNIVALAQRGQFHRDTYSDVPRDAWFFEAVRTLYNEQIIRGYPDNTFRPNQPITRGELAVMAARFDGLYSETRERIFSDVEHGTWSAGYIHGAAEVGWVRGYPDGTFRPTNPITRAEVVTLINRVLEQTLHRDDVPYGVNPFNDLVSSHWAYGDIIEASVLHDVVEWHGTAFNDGEINVTTSLFLDVDGNELAEPTVTMGEAIEAPVEVHGHVYYGYVTVITYLYELGIVEPYARKLANTAEAVVGDTIHYAIIVGNAETATYPWRNVVFSDPIPEGLTFVPGTVYLDHQSVSYTYRDGVISLPIGDLAPGQGVIVNFRVTVNMDMHDQTIYNTAIISSDNEDDMEVPDDGVRIRDGEVFPEVVKAADRASAQVGDRVTYTVTITNGEEALVPWRDVVFTDELDPRLIFENGSVYVNGYSTRYSFRDRVITVHLGDIAPGETVVVEFGASIAETAFNQTIYNVAVLNSANHPDVEAPDDGVAVEDGEAAPEVTKTADRAAAQVGDRVTYTITIANGRQATVPWRDIVLTDELDPRLIFEHGSVYLNRQSVSYSYEDGVITVPIGNLAPGEQVVVTFRARIADGTFGETIHNIAVVSSDNAPDEEAPDGGIEIADGRAFPEITKAADRTTARVGDRVVYTVAVTNTFRATVPWRNVVLTDVIDPHLTFEHGSVQVNGRTVPHGFANGVLTVELGDIPPDTTLTVTFAAVVNSTAYSQTIRNVAIADGDNGGPVEAPAEDIQVYPGVAWGQVSKMADRTTASVGETITYTVTAANIATATYPWQNVVVTDVISEHLEFIDGSVTVNGSTANVDSHFNANTRTLTVRLGNIAPGETATVAFRVRVLNGAQGMFITNVAYVSSDGRDPLPAPDRGVEIEAGSPAPSARKSANVSTAQVGERVTYTITLSNGITATAPWRNVVINDVIPAGFSLVHGSIMVDGVSHVHGVAGQALTIRVGDIVPGQTVVVTFHVTALPSGMGQTWYNVASISSDNDPQRQVTDDGVTIPEEEFGEGGNNGGGDGDGNALTVTATKSAGVPSARPGDTVTYTITTRNNSENTWYNVTMTDLLDTGAVTFISGSVQINGIPANAGQHSYHNRLLTVRLGNIVPGQTAVVTFRVVIKPDAHDTTIHNIVTLVGSSVRDGALDTMVRANAQVPIPRESNPPVSGIHMQLFQGYPDGTWRPERNMNRAEAAIMFYRVLVRPGPGTASLPSDVPATNFAADAIRYFLSAGAVSVDGSGNFRPGDDITMRDFNRLAREVIGRSLLPDTDDTLSRILAAAVVAEAQGRSQSPNTNNMPYNTFTDVPPSHRWYGLVTEMSTDHGYFYDLHGNEWWEAF